ncbi:MAG: helix-turn-helix domain-containing protein [Clostridiales bacterium]|jgi:AraC-like DNA-binding protein|nr:helix-turn-helix domain-containing protein [Clostridiales bacterium]
MFDSLSKMDMSAYVNKYVTSYGTCFDFKNNRFPSYAVKNDRGAFIVTTYHLHSRFEITLITEGSARYKIDSKWYYGRKGDLIMVNPYEMHYAEVESESELFSYICIGFDPKFMEIENSRRPYEFFNRIADGTVKIKNHIPSAVAKSMAAFVRGAYNACVQNADLSPAVINADLLMLFAELHQKNLTSLSAPQAGGNTEFIKGVIKYVLENYSRRITSTTAAEALAFNNSYFCRRFRKLFGITFGEYLNYYRLSSAKKQIEHMENDSSIAEIARRSGFFSYHYFSREFSRVFGLSPARFRAASEKHSDILSLPNSHRGDDRDLKQAAPSPAVYYADAQPFDNGERRDFPADDGLIRIFSVTGGGAIFEINGGEYKAAADAFIVQNPGDTLSVQNTGGLCCSRVDFGVEWLKSESASPFCDYLSAISDGALKIDNLIGSSPVLKKYAVEICRICQNVQTEREIRELAVKGRLILMLAALQSRKLYTRLGDDPGGGFKRNMLEFLDANYKNDLTVTDAARAVSYNKSYFALLFKKVFGMSFKKYLTAYRMDIAMRLINDGERSVSKCAVEAGFNSISYFTKSFKARFGRPPQSAVINAAKPDGTEQAKVVNTEQPDT